MTWHLLTPAGGYDLIGEWDNYCVGPLPSYSDENSSAFRVDCFDLSEFIGNEVKIGFNFGSDSSVTYAGWSILWAALSGPESPVERSSWGSIKGLYR